jgi:hypothetical protein
VLTVQEDSFVKDFQGEVAVITAASGIWKSAGTKECEKTL